ncbi:puromycin-sensitive aminopeptidase-like protein, partial [Leptotrombidium deliense]
RRSVDGKVVVRVYTPVGKKGEGLFALDVAVRALDFYRKYLGIDFPLPKLDIVAVRDLDAGGMENWGIILELETLTLYDNNKSPVSTRQGVASVIIHEIAHQYYGDLVTTKWWTDIWVNEGFAEYFVRSVTATLFPEWKYELISMQAEYSSALYIDSFKNTFAVKIQYLNQSEMDLVLDRLI